MSNLAIRLMPEVLRTLAFGSIGANYSPIGTPFENPSRILILQNLTDATLMFSFNGIDDNLAIAGPGSFVLDITSNRGVAGALYIAEGTTIFVKQIDNPGVGAVYVSTFFGDSGL